MCSVIDFYAHAQHSISQALKHMSGYLNFTFSYEKVPIGSSTVPYFSNDTIWISEIIRLVKYYHVDDKWSLYIWIMDSLVTENFARLSSFPNRCRLSPNKAGSNSSCSKVNTGIFDSKINAFYFEIEV